jgi:signal peptidase I
VLVVGVTALVISFLIKTFIVQAFWIPSGSMEDTLVYGDRVMVSKIQAGPTEIERGDIAVFVDPGGWLMHQEVQSDRGPFLNAVFDGLEFVGLLPAGESNHLIKRVIGVGGDHIVCCDEQGRVTVNGMPLDEGYLFPGDEPSSEAFDIVVPEGHFWMMGDHRSNSRDSRANDDGSGAGGAVPEENMVGQAIVLVWPLDRVDWFADGADDVFEDVPAATGGSGS